MKKSVLQLFAHATSGSDVEFYNGLVDHLQNKGFIDSPDYAPSSGCRVCVIDWFDFKPPFEDLKDLKPTYWNGKTLAEIENDLVRPGETRLTLGLFDPRLGPVDRCIAYLSRHDCDGIIVGETLNVQDQAEIDSRLGQISLMGIVALQTLDIR